MFENMFFYNLLFTLDFIYNNLFHFLESLGIVAFGLSGILAAQKKNFDLVGMFSLCCITAFGGGTLRDLILDIHPIYWVKHSEFAIALFFISLFFYIFLRKKTINEKWLILPDSLGIAFFTATTAQLSYFSGYPLIILAILSTIVACFGGVLRDVFCHQIPFIFHKNSSLYATLSFLGACFYYILSEFTKIDQNFILFIVVCLIFFSRILSHKYDIKYALLD